MENQLFILLIFILSGYVIGILFDLFRITRKLFKLPNFVTYIEDVLFWILTGIILIFVIYNINGGAVRFYHIIGLLFGVFFYFISISRLIFKIISYFKTKFSHKA